MRIARRQWLCALCAALMVHVGVAVWLLWQPRESGAVGAGIGGVEVSLGPAGGAPGGEAQLSEEVTEADEVEPDSTATPAEETTEMAEVSEPEQVETAETEVTSAVTEEPQETPVEPSETVPIERAEPVETETAARWALAETTDVEPMESVQPDEITPIETDNAPPPDLVQSAALPPPDSPLPEPVQPTVEAIEEQPVEAVEEQPVETAEPVPQEPETVETASRPAPPVPRRRPAEAPRKVVEAAPAQQVAKSSVVTAGETDQIAKINPSVAGAGGKAGTEASPEAGSGDATSAGGIPGASADYMALLQAWLEKHKEYPRRAQLRRQEGTALLYFVMDREGRVITHRLEESSGHRLLDREVEEMIERAQPLPKMPDHMSQAQLELIVPVQFFLR